MRWKVRVAKVWLHFISIVCCVFFFSAIIVSATDEPLDEVLAGVGALFLLAYAAFWLIRFTIWSIKEVRKHETRKE